MHDHPLYEQQMNGGRTCDSGRISPLYLSFRLIRPYTGILTNPLANSDGMERFHSWVRLPSFSSSLGISVSPANVPVTKQSPLLVGCRLLATLC
jgi:hypothetical protein